MQRYNFYRIYAKKIVTSVTPQEQTPCHASIPSPPPPHGRSSVRVNLSCTELIGSVVHSDRISYNISVTRTTEPNYSRKLAVLYLNLHIINALYYYRKQYDCRTSFTSLHLKSENNGRKHLIMSAKKVKISTRHPCGEVRRSFAVAPR